MESFEFHKLEFIRTSKTSCRGAAAKQTLVCAPIRLLLMCLGVFQQFIEHKS